ncbi:tetratricopeptide repeat protein [Lactobacillus acetotolerans]|uniref:Tetratricopeptide repeat protein n=1 Tax=Lactobacillus acetotolerans TaxID=1600 RepID=A0A356VRB3_9LACO|nr:tetratricopeptide repeat protein [Lactobacillus acetotolerans]MBN7276008.1 tetratricopeptide repeat protein [Lactobacillus acetotolerans]QFG51347.1 tetratricopeptide repeat protein [Lactobacillus acetotolerans]QGV04540.1 tetratricopeptide repeat protein [Lactobacillus acetotolerans]QJD73644.1 tetratricopeptide repeat protein [Lactobacillus acetotolerans]GGV09781.1 peptide-binding protein [Lactobacillus acetotolerans DSM 20749 = JCM 3825]
MSYSEQLLDSIEKQDFSQQKILLKKALNNDKPEILASLAENLTDLGFTNLSKQVYRALIAKFPKEDLFKVYLAEILLNDGDDDDGLSLLYNVSESSPAYVDSLLVQADYYQTNGLLETAKTKLLKALKIDPDEDAIKFGLAELDYLSGKYEEALPIYQDLIKRQKNFSEVNLNQRIFQTLAKLGQYEDASKIIKEHSEDILDIDSKYQAGLVMLSVGDYDQAIKYLDSVIEQSPDYVNAYPLLAEAYEHKHDDNQVLHAAQTGLAYNELDQVLYSKGARAAANLKDFKTAEKLLKKGLKVAPDNNDLRLQLSNLYLSEHKDKENLDLFASLDDDDIEPQAYWNMAISYERMDNSDKAKSEFLLAYPEFKDNSTFLKQMIRFFSTEANSDEIVKQLLERYLKLVPEDDEMQDLYNQLQ